MRTLSGIFLLMLLPSIAYGHDAKNPKLDQWYEGLKRPLLPPGDYGGRSQSCCGKDECHTTDAERRNGVWWARIASPRRNANGTIQWDPGPFVRVPDEIIVRGQNGNPVANEAGEAVLCHSMTWMNNVVSPTSTLFCFVPPNEF